MDSVTHNAVVLSHMLMAAGTTSDDFLRYHTCPTGTSTCPHFFNCRTSKDWLKSSRLWAKFSAIASLGVVHKVCATSPSHDMKDHVTLTFTGAF